MKDFGVWDRKPDEFCLTKIAECDVFVGIIGNLHRSCPSSSEQSYTEQEYNIAIATGEQSSRNNYGIPT